MPDELKKLTARPVWIEWIDSVAAVGWVVPGEYLMYDGECLTLGFLVWENDEAVCVAATVSATGKVSDPITISRCAIKKIQRVWWPK